MHNPERGVPNASRKRSMFRSTASCSSPSPWRRLRLPYGPSEVPPCRVENPCGAAIPETVRSRRREVILIVAFLDPEVAALHQPRSEEHTSELQSRGHLVCRLLLEKTNST